MLIRSIPHDRDIRLLENGQRLVPTQRNGFLVLTDEATGRERRYKILHAEDNGRRTSYFCADEPGDEDLQLRFSKEGRLESWMKPRTWLCRWEADSRREAAVAKGGTDAEIADRYNKGLHDNAYIYEPKATATDVAEWKADWEAGLKPYCPRCCPGRRMNEFLARSYRRREIERGGTNAEIARRYKKVMQDLGYDGERPTEKNVARWRAAIEREEQARRNARWEHN